MKACTIRQLNGMDRQSFTAALDEIFEHSPWIAERAWSSRPFAGKEQLHTAMLAVVDEAGEEEKLGLIRAHPDLGTRLRMSELSVGEQRGAGLSELTADEFAEFSACNRAYTQRFGFPFIIAVKGKSKAEILDAMKRRLASDREREKRRALRQIAEIARFRLDDLILLEEESNDGT